MENENIPAISYEGLTRWYDLFIRLTLPERRFKNRLIEQARVEPGFRVLDLGCGTATLTLLIKNKFSSAEVIGLDADPKILAIAEHKIKQAGLDIRLNRGMAFQLPYPDNFFDRVFSSLVLHHLNLKEKYFTLKEVYRVLRPGGEFHLADIGKPHNLLMFLISRLIRRMEKASDNIKGMLPEMLWHAGYKEVLETDRFSTVFGTLSLFRSVKSG